MATYSEHAQRELDQASGDDLDRRNKFDVVAVAIADPHQVRILGKQLTERNAEAVIKLAVMRRGGATEFYKAVTAGSYFEGECWLGNR
jgi:hypothetical protein